MFLAMIFERKKVIGIAKIAVTKIVMRIVIRFVCVSVVIWLIADAAPVRVLFKK